MSKTKTIRARVQVVFLVHGLRRIRELPCTILVSEKRTWAEEPCGRRHLLGTSAFFTAKAAEVRKLGELRKIAANPYPVWHVAGKAADGAKRQLKTYAEKGTFH